MDKKGKEKEGGMMCKDYIHEQAVKVFKKVLALSDELKNSKRKEDLIFVEPTSLLIRKSFLSEMVTSFFIFIVPNSQVKYCMRAWEISGSYEKPGEDLFYYIKSSMIQNNKTFWFVFPMQIRDLIECCYDPKDFKDDLSFLDQPTEESQKVFTHCRIQDDKQDKKE